MDKFRVGDIVVIRNQALLGFKITVGKIICEHSSLPDKYGIEFFTKPSWGHDLNGQCTNGYWLWIEGSDMSLLEIRYHTKGGDLWLNNTTISLKSNIPYLLNFVSETINSDATTKKTPHKSAKIYTSKTGFYIICHRKRCYITSLMQRFFNNQPILELEEA